MGFKLLCFLFPLYPTFSKISSSFFALSKLFFIFSLFIFSFHFISYFLYFPDNSYSLFLNQLIKTTFFSLFLIKAVFSYSFSPFCFFYFCVAFELHSSIKARGFELSCTSVFACILDFGNFFTLMGNRLKEDNHTLAFSAW